MYDGIVCSYMCDTSAPHSHSFRSAERYLTCMVAVAEKHGCVYFATFVSTAEFKLLFLFIFIFYGKN